MSKFKIGDRVKIPTTKSFGRNVSFLNDELTSKAYDKCYLKIVEINEDYIALEFFDFMGQLDNGLFLESDLELYEEEMTIPPIELLGLTEPNNVKSNNEEEKLEGEKGTYEWTHDLNADSKCDIWKRLIFAYADENDYNAVKEIAALAEKLK